MDKALREKIKSLGVRFDDNGNIECILVTGESSKLKRVCEILKEEGYHDDSGLAGYIGLTPATDYITRVAITDVEEDLNGYMAVDERGMDDDNKKA